MLIIIIAKSYMFERECNDIFISSNRTAQVFKESLNKCAKEDIGCN